MVQNKTEYSETILTDVHEIEKWLTKKKIEKWSIGSNGTVSVNGDVEIPKYTEFLQVQFSTVHGNFFCANANLTTLNGCPRKVIGSFICSNNQLETLEGGPEYVDGHFNCNSNNLKSLQFGPTTVRGDYRCLKNQLVNLIGAPKEIGNFKSGSFACSNNQLETLEGCPGKIHGHLLCMNNNLTTLVGISDIIQKIHGGINFSGNNLTSGGLEILLIDGLTDVIFPKNNISGKPYKIIKKYVKEKQKDLTRSAQLMFDCQEELIKEGYGEFAQL